MEKNDIKQYSLANLKAQRTNGKTATRAYAPAYAIDADFWDKAKVVMPSTGKTSVHLRVDTDVLNWFRSLGHGHLTRMNAVLKSYAEAHKQQP